MDLSAPSIFELSPSEKLQLVEDFWDDIASTSGGVPVHDWQIQELDRRKRNLLTNPGPELSWDEVRRACASGMVADLIVAPKPNLMLRTPTGGTRPGVLGLEKSFCRPSTRRSHTFGAIPKLIPLSAISTVAAWSGAFPMLSSMNTWNRQ